MPSTEQQAQRQVAAARAEEEARRQRREETIQALVDRIHKAREAIEQDVAHLQDACLELRTVVRRNYDEASSSYLVFANAHLRLAGALVQGVRRTASMDRMLNRAQEEREEARRREMEHRRAQEVRDHARHVQKLQLPTEDAFDEVYGEVMGNAV